MALCRDKYGTHEQTERFAIFFLYFCTYSLGCVTNLSFGSIVDYGGTAERDLEDLSEKQISEKLQELNLIGQQALKATAFPWQSSVPNDIDSVAFEDIPNRYR